MESKKKVTKRATAVVPDSDEETSSKSDVQSEEENETAQVINVEFEAQTPVESDFHGIRQLLMRVFLLLQVDISELCELIISQTSVGSTIKIVDDDDDDIYGVVSALSMRKYKDQNCIKELENELLLRCKTSAKQHYSKLENIFRDKCVGFIVNERFINIPCQIAVPFHQSLRDEVLAVASEDPTFNFDYLLLLSKTLQPSTDTTKEDSTKEVRKKKRLKQHGNEDEIEYTNFEDEIFNKASELSFSYSITEKTGHAIGGSWNYSDKPMNTIRTVMLVPKAKWNTILSGIKDLVVT